MVADGKPYRNQKIVFVFLWFCSGNIRCKWNPYYRMGSLRNKDKHCLKFAFPGTTFFFSLKWVLQIASPVCVQYIHLWELETTEEQTPNNHLSNAEKAWKKKHHCLHLTNITKATWRVNKVKKNQKKSFRTHAHTWAHKAISLQHITPLRVVWS